jgi:hypothetical protein
MTIESVLSHPVFLLIVGAILSVISFNFLARGWQKHQKELEIKIESFNQNK